MILCFGRLAFCGAGPEGRPSNLAGEWIPHTQETLEELIGAMTISTTHEPTSEIPTARESGQQESESSSTRRGVNALLIEDDDADFELISKALRQTRMQFHFTRACRLSTGLEQLQKTNFDVVLADLSLPESFGLETVKAIRELNSDVPVVVLTTLDDPDLEWNVLEVGAQDYVVKDEAVPRILERVVKHAMQRQRSRLQIERLLSEVENHERLLVEQKALLEKKNRRLRHLYKTANRFVDNVSHEFRTPLTVIKDYVLLVRDGLAGEINSEQRRMLDIAAVRTDDLNNMVDDMLDIGKLEAGLLGVWRRNHKLKEIVRQVCPPLQLKASVRKIQFESSVANDLPPVYCDGDKIGRVIINLVVNAMKFCGENGSVRLWAEHDRDRHEILVGVTDTGPGIEETAIEAIFKRFRQINTSFKTSTKGFGLGLNIAKELVDLNFGRMSVQSEMGKGSTFTFSIPVADPLEIMRRFLARMEQKPESGLSVALVRFFAKESTSDGDADDLDAFFNFLLRRNDLLFRFDRRQWLFVLGVSGLEVKDFLPRVEREFRQANRNRPFGLLPAYQAETMGRWSVHRELDQILETFRESMSGVTGGQSRG